MWCLDSTKEYSPYCLRCSDTGNEKVLKDNGFELPELHNHKVQRLKNKKEKKSKALIHGIRDRPEPENPILLERNLIRQNNPFLKAVPLSSKNSQEKKFFDNF